MSVISASPKVSNPTSTSTEADRRKRSIKYLPKHLPQPRDIVVVPCPHGAGWLPADKRNGMLLQKNRPTLMGVTARFPEIADVWAWVDNDYERQMLMATRLSRRPAQTLDGHGTPCPQCNTPMHFDMDHGTTARNTIMVVQCENCGFERNTKTLIYAH